MFNDMHVKTGIKLVTDAVAKHFLRQEMARDVETQRAVFKGDRQITNVLSRAQEEAKYRGQKFVPDLVRAENNARVGLEFGIGQRLRGAYASYKAGMQLECLRHVLIALDVVCCALDWDKASAYLNEQNRILQQLSKSERDAA